MRRGRGLSRRRVSVGRRRLLLAAAVLAAAVLALVLVVVARADDPFCGTYWEPATSRRIEIGKDGGQYWFYYGAARRPHRAMLVGDELRVSQPLGDPIIVRQAHDGRLDLVSDGTTTQLRLLPEER